MFRILKRLVDLLLSGLLLIFFSPVMLLTALMIRSKMGAPILFQQTRPGLQGQPFRLYKFRTMTEERDESGRLLSDEQRMTRLGAFLRKTSLDELPQLLNVWKGELSLVGPRPLLMEYLGLYTPEQAKRHLAKPGITGWAQVNGRNAISWEEKFRLDVWYVEHQSLLLDLKILAMTVLKVLKSEGIHQERHVTMKKFTGSSSS